MPKRTPNPIDIGAYLHVVGDCQLIANRYSYRYPGNLAGVVAGYAATVDQKSALTYKKLSGIQQVWFLNFGMMDALSFAKINMLRGDEAQPTLLHDQTAVRNLEGVGTGLDVSDWSQLYRMNLKFLMSAIVFSRGKQFLGENSINGLQAASMKTAFDSDADTLKKRGYITDADFDIYRCSAIGRFRTMRSLPLAIWTRCFSPRGDCHHRIPLPRFRQQRARVVTAAPL